MRPLFAFLRLLSNLQYDRHSTTTAWIVQQKLMQRRLLIKSLFIHRYRETWSLIRLLLLPRFEWSFGFHYLTKILS